MDIWINYTVGWWMDSWMSGGGGAGLVNQPRGAPTATATPICKAAGRGEQEGQRQGLRTCSSSLGNAGRENGRDALGGTAPRGREDDGSAWDGMGWDGRGGRRAEQRREELSGGFPSAANLYRARCLELTYAI
ncbi:hypothetical protein VFPFJ_01804 [Purpureocillium lilacinum]|uniref:Uncharacterized protein n=1 Tax=Purpureocillium lilacinum TaxID=33203 RepID=A0A179HTG7_PURLI|nr:hypothetical protein VFPFJ_01804 [Purpureocillium lilacinum]OAQ92643.1 hypothetical protein VFPFJ_01804 [Purpureocillium lilacinum]